MVGAVGERPGPCGGLSCHPVWLPWPQLSGWGWGVAFSQVSTTSCPLAYVGPFLCPLQDICKLCLSVLKP